MLRIATAAVLAPLLWAMIKLGPNWAFFVFALVMILGGCWEFYRMLSAGGTRPFVGLGLLGAAGVCASFVEGPFSFDASVPIVALSLSALLFAMRRRGSPREMLDASVATLVPVVFVALSLSYLIGLREMAEPDGEDLILLLFICVIFSDTGAYFVGKNFGKRRIAPMLSPKKTWEGVVGGILASVGAALLAQFWFYQRLPLGHALILGVVLAVAGILGDLAESMVKRSAGFKDSSSLLPGHGGILDRTDSLLFTAPFLYYYYFMFLQVP